MAKNNGIQVQRQTLEGVRAWSVLDCTKGKSQVAGRFRTQKIAHAYAVGLAWLMVYAHRFFRTCEVVVHNASGRIRRKDTVGFDPIKTRG